MEEITLTGGTMVSGAQNSQATAHSHSHGHSHGHSHTCDHGHEGGAVEMSEISPSLEDLADAPKEEIVRALSTLLRFGRFEAMEPILKQLNDNKSKAEVTEVLKTNDEGGHTLVHWAAKRVDDSRFIQKLVSFIVELKIQNILNTASSDEVGMRPLHWACTEGSIPHVALLLKNGADIEAKDNSGCTPLLIAAQYGQVEVVAYLLKNGANIKAVDSSRDSALHWAAYKGSIEVCGLLSYHQTLDWTTQDSYGQTPLHLAALRGHTTVVHYILSHLSRKDILFQRDQNERTPLDLAVHKNRPTVEAVLKEAMSEMEDPRAYFLRKTLVSNTKEMFSAKTWKSWLGLSAGMDEMDKPSRFPYYFVILNYVIHIIIFSTVFAPVGKAESGIMWDLSGWILWNYLVTFGSWYYFYKTVKTKPGFLDDSLPTIGKWRRLYDETLEAYADENSVKKVDVQLCHTCHVARPHRAKHCKVSRKCVLLFDHYCPFVDNTVGLYNYKYFYIFLVFMTLALSSFVISFYIYLHRYTKDHSMPWGLFFAGLEVCLTAIPISGMCIYHTQLAMVNLSTNEHLNLRKYKYLFPIVNGRRQYKNPWFKGWWGNFMDRMNPSEDCYVITGENESLIMNRGDDIV